MEPESTIFARDRDNLLVLIYENSEKLNRLCEKIDHENRIGVLIKPLYNPKLGNFFAVLAIILLIALLIIIRQLSIAKGNVFFHVHGLLFTIFFSFVLLFLILAFSLATFFNYNRNQIKSLSLKSRLIATKLEKMIRISSQLETHEAKNLSRYLEMELRIADAESALSYFDMLMKNIKV